MARYVEILFRHWMRFAVILILMPVPVSIATLIYFRTVQSTTNLWVEEPTYLGADISSNNVAGWNQYLTPSQNVTDEMTQYLQTASFLYAVGDKLQQTGISDAGERNKLIGQIPKNMHVIPNGSHLVTITFSCDKSADCNAVLDATIVVFQGKLTDQLKAQEQLSTSFLQSQLVAAQQKSDESESALNQYLLQHPGIVAAEAGTTSGNPELDKLVSQAQQDRDKLTTIQNQLAQAQFTFAAADRFIATNTNVVDPPRITAGGLLGDGSSVRRAALVWLAAVGVAAAYLVLLVGTDRTARETREIVGRLSVPVLATVPLLTAKERF